jgi:dephospho-CoA kinase
VIVAGLTGSIGMGKSATTAMFAEEGVPVHDADAAVHALYDVGGAAVGPIEAAFPGVMREGRIDRALLGARVVGDPAALARLEAIVHPLVGAAREAFLDHARKLNAPLAVVDIPLLFETGAEDAFDALIVVTAPADVQRARVLARPGMTAEKFEALLARQTPDAEKRRRADYLIDTGKGLEAARGQVRRLIALLTQSQA